MFSCMSSGMHLGGFCTLVGLALAFVACETTRQTRSAQPAGFLGDYSQLRPGTGDEAQFVYLNPAAQWPQYKAMLLDSVTLWQTDRTTKLAPEDAQRLTDYLYAELHKHLSQDYQMVTTPGPGVMRLRAAITEAQGANVVGHAVTTIVPQLRAATTLGGMTTDSAVFAGKAGVEAEATDSLTGERLGAVIDERVGTKTFSGGLGEWSQVDRAYEVWAERLRKRLAEIRKS